jgi:hypothetical protein
VLPIASRRLDGYRCNVDETGGDYVNRLTKVVSNLVKVKVEEDMKAHKRSLALLCL